MGKRFDLPPEWNIYSALASRDALLSWVAAQHAKGQDVFEISASQVSEVDGAGLQLLAALAHQDVQWKLVDASDVFSSACRTLGFQHWLEGIGEKMTGA